jgi:putative nucleotidyltransferase with HDIG domain
MAVDSYESPDAEALLRDRDEQRARTIRTRRELVTFGFGAATFLLAAVALAALAPWHRSLSVVNLVLVLALYVAAQQVKFPVTSGWTAPTMLVFVPMLFMLPTPIVPSVVMAAVLLSRARDLLRRSGRIAWASVFVGDAWFSFGPALVIVLGGAQRFAWAHWPIYAAALLGQVLFDLASTVGRCSIGEGVDPRVQLPLLVWVYSVDAALAPLGLAIAAVSAQQPGLALLALSPMAMLSIFARERQQRLDHTLSLSSAYRGTALLLGEVIEVDDAYTGIHSREVVDLAMMLAEALGLDSTTRRNVEFTALLHDVGKIHVPKDVLHKPGSLTDDEWKILHQHTIEGERMLRQVGGSLASVGQFVRSSHERYDGHGYPDRLAGDAIPIESRIVSVCDAFNAMTTDRPYHGAMTVTDALAELRREAGRQFDPRVVEAFHSLVKPDPDAAKEVPRWVRIPEGQVERALKMLAAQRGRHEHADATTG